MIRSGSIIFPICHSPITGRSIPPRTRWATGWKPMPESWSWISGALRFAAAPSMTPRRVAGMWWWTGRTARWSCIRCSLSWRPACPVRRACPALPAWRRSKASNIIPRITRTRPALAGKNVVVVGGNNSAHDICVDLWAKGRQGHHDPAFAHHGGQGHGSQAPGRSRSLLGSGGGKGDRHSARRSDGGILAVPRQGGTRPGQIVRGYRKRMRNSTPA